MSNYQLPIASKTTLGGVKIGEYLKVNDEGELSVDITDISLELQNTLNSIEEGKELLAIAISNMGVPTSKDDTFQVMANNIGKITIDSSLSNLYLK